MIHITDYPCFHEKGYYTPGDRGVPVYRTPFGRLGIAICYDRHYPEYMRVLAGGGTDEILVCDLDLAQADDSHARRLFLRDRRPDLYGDWLR